MKPNFGRWQTFSLDKIGTYKILPSIVGRRNLDKQRSTSPRSTLRKFNSAAKLNEDQVTPPGSPPSYRRSGSRDETGKNVFHR